ncbi:putative selenate ABC transporter substrate-binding protein [Verrucomicrobiales bacterium]|jgi:phosphonate transport system substrate-binding protein|nr:putative selenate ABC transporter substrate-binding protein [Verrucomicrobiales bacterium]MDB3941536.1 putative selenate ABC transporter substrate-binding protein [Verrucomicrobiales bacterium]
MLKSYLFRVGLAAVTTLALVGCGGDTSQTDSNKSSSETLYISAIPDEKVTDQIAKFGKLSEHLSGELGVDVEFVSSTDYTDSITKFTNGEVHLVWFGGLSGVQARMAVPGAQAIAQGKADPKYKSYFIANKATGLKPSEDFPAAIKDVAFTFGSPGSTSGRLMPTYFIMQNNGGVEPDKWFAQKPGYQMSGGHVATANAVADGTYQTGALNYKTYDSLVESDPKIAENTVKIWTTPFYADYNFTIHPEVNTIFGDGFIEKVQAALISVPAGSDAIKAINRDSVIAAKNADFDGIKDTAVKMGLIEK